jgi:hypothetical protein
MFLAEVAVLSQMFQGSLVDIVACPVEYSLKSLNRGMAESAM